MALLIICLAYQEADADNPNMSMNSLSLMQDAKGKGKEWAVVYLIGSKDKSEKGFSDDEKLQKLSSTHKVFGSVVETISGLIQLRPPIKHIGYHFKWFE